MIWIIIVFSFLTVHHLISCFFSFKFKSIVFFFANKRIKSIVFTLLGLSTNMMCLLFRVFHRRWITLHDFSASEFVCKLF